jgi:dCTP deaminase
MAILSDKDLKKVIEEENAVYVEDGPELDKDLQIGPSSIDLRLGYDFGYLETRKVSSLDTKNMDDISDLQRKMEATPEEGVVVHPGEFIIGTTLETVKIPENLVARIEGRSSYARLGLIPHAAGGFVDAGFEGQITLEIQNLGNVPITIYPEDRICQMAIETMTSQAENPYGEKKDSKYMHQKGATGARLDEEKR